MEKFEKVVLGGLMMPTVGAFALSSISTQDSALGNETVFNADTQRPMIALGWVITGATGALAGAWAKSKTLSYLGLGVAIGGLIWTYVVPHPLFNRDKSRNLNSMAGQNQTPTTSHGIAPYQNTPDRPAVAQGVSAYDPRSFSPSTV